MPSLQVFLTLLAVASWGIGALAYSGRRVALYANIALPDRNIRLLRLMAYGLFVYGGALLIFVGISLLAS